MTYRSRKHATFQTQLNKLVEQYLGPFWEATVVALPPKRQGGIEHDWQIIISELEILPPNNDVDVLHERWEGQSSLFAKVYTDAVEWVLKREVDKWVTRFSNVMTALPCSYEDMFPDDGWKEGDDD